MKKRARSRVKKEICQWITDLIADYLSDNLSLPAKRQFERHMSVCPDCVAFLKTYKKTLELTRSFLNAVPPEDVRRAKPAVSAKARRAGSR